MDEPTGQGIGDYERRVEVMIRLWGRERAEALRALWRRASPNLERYIVTFALGEIWARPTLDLKTRCLLCLAAAVALEREGQIRLHTRGALQSGATPAEVTEAVLQLLIYASFPAAWQVLVIVREVIAEHAGSDSGSDGGTPAAD